MGRVSGSNQSPHSNKTKKNKVKMYYQNQSRQRGRGGNSSGGYNSRGRGGYAGGGGGGYYKQKETLAGGMKGFLCSCNFNERDCVKEAYNLLNEYWEKIETETETETHKPVDESAAADPTDTNSEAVVPVESGDDVEAEINAEIKELNRPARKYRFQSIQSGARNIVFIRTTLDDPSALAHTILEDIFNKKEQKSRYLLRLLPIDGTCHTNLHDILDLAKNILPKYFTKNSFQSYQVAYKCRNNDSMNRDEVIRTMAETAFEINPLSVVDLTNPQLVIIVEIIKTVFCLGVARDFNLYKKYNLIEAAGIAKEDEGTVGAAASASVEVEKGDGDKCIVNKVEVEPGNIDIVTNTCEENKIEDG